MENKKSIGITILGVYLVVTAAANILLNIIKISNGDVRVLTIYSTALGLISLFLAIHILRLKEWARKTIIFYTIFKTAMLVFIINPLTLSDFLMSKQQIPSTKITVVLNMTVIVYALIIIYFFTRPKVKGSFK